MAELIRNYDGVGAVRRKLNAVLVPFASRAEFEAARLAEEVTMVRVIDGETRYELHRGAGDWVSGDGGRWIAQRMITAAEIEAAHDTAAIAAAAAEVAAERAERVIAQGDHPPRVQRRLNNIAVEGLFEGAERATQGLAVIEHEGQIHAFVTHVVAGGTYLPDERIRILHCILSGLGDDLEPVEISDELAVGHGQDIGAEVIDGQFILWTTMATPEGGTALAAGKGFSRIVWRGVETSQADVTEYRVCGQPGSGHRREGLYQGSVGLSSDGRYLILVPEDDDPDREHLCLVFDKTAVMAAADPLEVDPVYSWTVPVPPHEYGRVVQGVHATARHVYILSGYYNPWGWTQVCKYSLQTGRMVDLLPVCAVQEELGRDTLLDGPWTGYRIEGEGLSMLGDDIYVGMLDQRYTGGSVVSFEGAHWAYIGTGATVTPHQMQYWQRSGKAASGPYNSVGSYTAGTLDRIRKSVWSLHFPRGEDGELPISPLTYYAETTVPGAYDEGVAQIAKIGTGWPLLAYSEALNKKYNLFLVFDNFVRLYDHRPGADNSEYALLERNSIAGETYIRGKASAAASAGLNFNDTDHPTQPGWARLLLPAVGAAPAQIINIRATDNPALWGNDGVFSLGLLNFFLRAVYSNNFALKDGISAPATVAGAAQIYVDQADGDLKVKFGDGTTKTIVTDS